MQKITPYLWFDNNAEEAVTFYTSLFDDSKIVSSLPGPDGKPMTLTFRLAGQQFIALNGGPMFSFTEAISFFITCDSQEEVDKYWDTLVANGGQESQCGWLKDTFGVSWQVVPKRLEELMADPDHVKAERVMQAMLKMQKIIIADLESAYRGE